MQNLGADRIKDETILVARILLIMLFIVFGWSKLTNYSGTVGSMTQLNLPMPSVAALVVIAVEVFVALAIAFGAWTRPLVVLLALYTLGLHSSGTTSGRWRVPPAMVTRSTSTRTSASLAD
jgi:putative oxidoreductase